MDGAVSPGNKPMQSCLEGSSSLVRDDLQVYCLEGHTDEDTDVDFYLGWPSDMSFLEGERTSIVHSSVGEWSSGCDSGSWHQLALQVGLSSSADDAFGADSPAEASGTQHMEFGTCRAQQQRRATMTEGVVKMFKKLLDEGVPSICDDGMLLGLGES